MNAGPALSSLERRESAQAVRRGPGFSAKEALADQAKGAKRHASQAALTVASINRNPATIAAATLATPFWRNPGGFSGLSSPRGPLGASRIIAIAPAAGLGGTASAAGVPGGESALATSAGPSLTTCAPACVPHRASRIATRTLSEGRAVHSAGSQRAGRGDQAEGG